MFCVLVVTVVPHIFPQVNDLVKILVRVILLPHIVSRVCLCADAEMWVAKERERVASEEFQAARDEAITNTTNIQLAQMKQGEAKMNSQMAYSKVDGVGLDIMRAFAQDFSTE